MRIAPPPIGTSQDDDRDEACAAALAPHVRDLVVSAGAAGWHEAEALCAILAAAIQGIRDGADDARTRAILESLILQLDE